MKGIPQYTTPTMIFTFKEEDLDLTQATKIIATLESVKTGKQIEKSKSDLTVEAKKITLELTQEETGAFLVEPVKVMINWTFANGKRGAMEEITIDISENLHREVM